MSTIVNLQSSNRYARAIRFAFLLAGISNFIRIKSSVQIIPTEIFAVILSLLSFISRRKDCITVQDIQILKYLNIYLLIALTNQVVIDQIKNIATSETLKSTAQTVVVWSLLRVAIIYIKVDVFRFISYVFGYFMSIILQLIIDPSAYMQVDPWKFAIGPAITGGLFLLFSCMNSFRGMSLWATLLIVIDISLGSRSLALFTLLALLITSRKNRAPNSRSAKYIGVAFALLIVLLGVERIYYQLSTTGFFGYSQQQKSLDQYRAGPIVLAGRSEFAFEVSAITQSPLLGHGSNPELTYKILNRTQKINSSLGVNTELTNAYKSTLMDGKIPQHSMLLGAWVEGGIIAFAFWVIFLFWAARMFILMPKQKPPLGNFATYAGVSTLWAIVFSPLGAGSRMELAIGLSALLIHSKIGHDATKN